MNTQLSEGQVEFYRENGFLVVEALLDGEELESWRAALAEGMAQHFAMNARHNQGTDNYYRDVFVQCVNLWKTSGRIKELVTDSRLGRLAAELAGVDGIRLLPRPRTGETTLGESHQLACRQRDGPLPFAAVDHVVGGA